MKYSNCPHCGGKLRSETLGWICEKCRGFIDMQGNFHEHIEKPFMPPMTNADRIRAMSDEELAYFLEGDYGNMMPGTALNWLRQPAEEADHDPG